METVPEVPADYDGIPIVKLARRAAAGDAVMSPSSVFISRSQQSDIYSRTSSYENAADLEDPVTVFQRDNVGVDSGSGECLTNYDSPLDESSGMGHADGSRESQLSIEDLLQESVMSFHREGPLVNPLGSAWESSESLGGNSIEDKMQFVTEVKGLDFGIFWKHDVQRNLFAYAGSRGKGLNQRTSATSVNLYIQASQTMFPTWIMGFGMVGRVGYTGNYEWHEDVTSLPAWSFQRTRQAVGANLKTLICVPVAGGVAEFGTSQKLPHNLLTVQYIQKIMGKPQTSSC